MPMTPADIPSEKSVAREERRILKYLSTLPYKFGGYDNPTPITNMALTKLETQGYIVRDTESDSQYRLTPAGWIRAEQMRLGRFGYWLKYDWLAALTGAATFALSLCSLLLGIWNALQAS